MSMTAAEAISAFFRLDLPQSFAGMKPLDQSTVKSLRLISGHAEAGNLAGNLSAAIRVLWVAQHSGELDPDDAAATIWLLSEVASLVEVANFVQGEAEYYLQRHEEALAKAGDTTKPTKTIQPAAEGGE